jgi:hypothetical protein
MRDIRVTAALRRSSASTGLVDRLFTADVVMQDQEREPEDPEGVLGT